MSPKGECRYESTTGHGSEGNVPAVRQPPHDACTRTVLFNRVCDRPFKAGGVTKPDTTEHIIVQITIDRMRAMITVLAAARYRVHQKAVADLG